MNKAAVHHRATDAQCYPLDESHLHIRLCTAMDDIDAVELVAGDPFEWERRPPPLEGRWMSTRRSMRKAGNDGVHDHWEIVWRPPWHRTRYFFLLHKGGQVWEYGEKGIWPATIPGGRATPAASPSPATSSPGALAPAAPSPGAGAASAASVTPADEGPQGDYWNSFVFPYINPVDVFKAPEWASRTIWYQIFPDRFANGDSSNDPPGTKAWHYGKVTNKEFYGGDLRGIIDRIDHIAGLGFTGIYLTPIFKASSVHKYDTIDYRELDPAFGSAADLRDLVAACHRRGMKLMLDAVFNHCGRDFAPWKDVVAKGADSEWAPWFHARFPLFPKGRDTGDARDSNFSTFAFWTGMPKFNTENPGLREYLMETGEYWIREFDIDGWRLDVANEIDHDFWREFRTRIKALKPDAYIVGEIWHDSMAWLRGDQYDAVMNYPYGTAISDYLQAKRHVPTGVALGQRLTAIDASYPLPVIRAAFNLLDSHDTERFISTLKGNRALARMGWFLLFLLPGSPCVYYGSEYGMEGGEDPDNRRCMLWDPGHQDQTMYRFFAALLAWRVTAHEACAMGRRDYLQAPDHPDLFGLRIQAPAQAGDQPARTLVAIASRSGTIPASLGDLPTSTGGAWFGASSWRVVLSGIPGLETGTIIKHPADLAGTHADPLWVLLEESPT